MERELRVLSLELLTLCAFAQVFSYGRRSVDAHQNMQKQILSLQQNKQSESPTINSLWEE